MTIMALENTMTSDARPLIIHVVYRFDTGGLENGIVNLINHLPVMTFRHLVLSLTESSPTFRSRIRSGNVSYLDLHKSPGHGIKLYPRLYRLFREWRPAIVHTRNLAALEAVVPALFAGVPVRIHGEHGWDSFDREGTSRKYRWMRRLYSPFVTKYVALSRQIQDYLIAKVGIDEQRIERIANGVDTDLFFPAPNGREPLQGCPFSASELTLIGTVGRLQAVKDQLNLICAFDVLIRQFPEFKATHRLVLVGEGPLRAMLESEVLDRNLREQVWFAGDRQDIPQVMRALDLFVLPSNSEGISNTILEAMASGLPVVATEVGGNAELICQHITGTLVPAADSNRLAQGILSYLESEDLRERHGAAGRARALAEFSIDMMMQRYSHMYESQLTVQTSAVASGQDARMPKIRLLMSGPLPPAIGGMASVIGMLAQSSLSSRFELSLIETGKTTPANRTLLQGLRARLGVMSAWWSRLARSDIAHIHTCSGFSFFLDSLLLLLARTRKVPVVLHVHGARFDDFLDGLPPWFSIPARGVMRRADVVIVLSDEWRQRLETRLPGARLRVVCNGVASDAIDPRQDYRHDEIEFLFLGNLGDRKGVPELLNAVACSSDRWRLLLAGGEEQPGYTDWVRNEIARLDRSDRIHVLGPVVGADKTRLLACASGFVLPSHAEGLPIALLEAMIAGLPVIVTAVGAMPEVVRDGEEGIVIPPGDVAALASALDRLSQSPEERTRMGQIAKTTCESRYGVERMVDSLVKIYADCTDDARRSRIAPTRPDPRPEEVPDAEYPCRDFQGDQGNRVAEKTLTEQQ
jgi:sugar transferase (PEP-CTERM/EpsH1 system associated)